MLTAPVGKELFVEKPTCVKDPEVGMMYMESVSLNETLEELAVIVQGTVVSELSTVKVMLVETEASEGPERPKYASPFIC